VAVQRTLVLLKPDAVQRGLVGTILNRFEQKGLKLIALKLRQFSPATFEKHYEPHKGKPFYPGLVKYMSSSPVVALALEGVDAIEVVRGLMGATNSRKAAPGTIRGDLGMSFSNNLVHGSDGPESAQRELALFFGDAVEVCEWSPVATPWIYNVAEELS
jgi:nucleoside-diphosphate kinase